MSLNEMFGWLDMIGTYESRKVARFELGDLVISTCRNTDCERPYETAVSHPSYNNNEWVIVAMYATREEAVEGHEEWVEKMTRQSLPDALVDVSEHSPAMLQDLVAGTGWRRMPCAGCN